MEEKVDVKKAIESLEEEIARIKKELGLDKESKSIVEIPLEKGKEITTKLMNMAQSIIKVASAAANGAIEGAKKSFRRRGEEGAKRRRKKRVNAP
jgi:cell division septum initiation protein DivIVA